MRSIIIGLIGLLPFIASPVVAADPATQEANKKAVLEFYDAALNRRTLTPPRSFSGRTISSTTRRRRTVSKASRPSSASCAKIPGLAQRDQARVSPTAIT
jgi:hypothetical protein